MSSNGKVEIAETNVNQRLSLTPRPRKTVSLRAGKNNSGDIYYGSSDIDGTNSDYMSPGELRILSYFDMYALYVRGTQGDSLLYTVI